MSFLDNNIVAHKKGGDGKKFGRKYRNRGV